MTQRTSLLGLGLLLTSMTSLYASTPAAPDVAHGEQLYARCMACHALTLDRVGPHHCGLLGRRAGSVATYDYSPAMKKSGLVWNEKTLDRFLRKPLAMVPGSTMTYDGVPLARDRTDLIAYLKAANQSDACRHLAARSPVKEK
jgi:cytochrome c